MGKVRPMTEQEIGANKEATSESGGGMNVVSGIFKIAQQIGDVNQTAQNQKGQTSFSWVADPAGALYQQRIFKKRLPGDQRDEQIQNEQRTVVREQGRALKLANNEEERKQNWNKKLITLLYGGRK